MAEYGELVLQDLHQVAKTPRQNFGHSYEVFAWYDGRNWQQMNNWPDANNHGSAGLNMGFADGHVEWVPRGPEIIRKYLASYHGAAMDHGFMMKQVPELRINNVKVGSKTYLQFSYSAP
jgi:prepilin-type processing-associated H-X9-DG protein